ncbi:hypothetical protein [Oceanomicrobium pacificus]|uniref:Uncharacterized protein n=1 Tax=Oceanomicrobium pacificus TaxID=2692916 RepID=A0A6B0TVC0_9RHOB|nr:hypothetical protein [Oceanomicrobium pacificus]MXU64913.1 hypothetical protein [Oceanomicrobium pacificus]
MFKRLLSLALVFGAVSTAPPLYAQSVCGDRDSVIDQLESRFGEVHAHSGLTGPGALLEIWTSPETGSFTVLMTRPNGSTCVMTTGEHWLDRAATMPVMGDPA